MSSLDFEAERSEFRRVYREDAEEFRSALSSFKGLVRALISDGAEFPTPIVTGRIKDCEESIAKFARKYRSKLEIEETPYNIIDHITDLLGVRVICYYESDIPKIVSILEDNFHVESITNKNEELSEDPYSFGYKGVHLDLRLNDTRQCLPEFQGIKNYRFELQLRTLVQNSWSEIEHKISYKKSVPNSLRHRIVRLSGLFELADQEFEAIRGETAELVAQAQAQNEKPPEDSMGFLKEPLNSVVCDVILGKLFEDYRSNSEYSDIFVAEVKKLNPNITIAQFLNIILDNKSRAEDYANYLEEETSRKLNPFTRVRLSLYQSDAELYSSILFPHVQKKFVEWRDSKN